MEFLRFVFSSFWVFMGMVVLLTVTLEGLAAIIAAFRCPTHPEQTP